MTFDESLVAFVKIDDELKRIGQMAKDLRKNKASLEAAISAHMVENDIPEKRCEDTSRIKIFTKKSTRSLYNKSGVYECAQVLFGTEKASALIRLMEEKKDVKESTGLKRLRTGNDKQ